MRHGAGRAWVRCLAGLLFTASARGAQGRGCGPDPALPVTDINAKWRGFVSEHGWAVLAQASLLVDIYLLASAIGVIKAWSERVGKIYVIQLRIYQVSGG